MKQIRNNQESSKSEISLWQPNIQKNRREKIASLFLPRGDENKERTRLAGKKYRVVLLEGKQEVTRGRAPCTCPHTISLRRVRSARRTRVFYYTVRASREKSGTSSRVIARA